ncbi:MAG: alkaline phosphatase family protein [Phycisphaerae bacterium]|jgi:hypothetical protein
MRLCFLATIFLLLNASLAATPVCYVIQISVDGLGSSYLKALNDANSVPNFSRLMTEGTWTLNARDDYSSTVTLPNHVTMITSRSVEGVTGHNWTSNSNPAPGETIHGNKGSYVASVFDVAHDNGLRTGLYAGKGKFSLFDASYNADQGAADGNGTDFGRDKLDTYVCNGNSSTLTSSFLSSMSTSPFNYSFVHFTDGDSHGHATGWGSTYYNDAIKTIDGYLGSILNLVETNETLRGKTAIILTADHGGTGYDHSGATNALNYTIPFMVWGPPVLAGSDLYSLNMGTRLDPGTGRPAYGGSPQPIRNGDGANLALELLGLEAIPDSGINPLQDLEIPEPATLFLLALGGLAVLRRRRELL